MSKAVVYGFGEIGQPITKLLRAEHTVYVFDPAYTDFCERPNVVADSLHVCIPYDDDFAEHVTLAIMHHRPSLTFIHSTIPPGTTQRIIKDAETERVVYTACHGMHDHNRMRADMLNYPKVVGAADMSIYRDAAQVLEAMGHPVSLVWFAPILDAEYAKLFATTYYGMLIAFAQEVRRAPGDSRFIMNLVQQTEGHLRIGDIFPGVIGGHCVIPNAELLFKDAHSVLLPNFISESNRMREREAEDVKTLTGSA